MAHGERAERNGRMFGGRGDEYESPRLWGYPVRGRIAKWITHRRERRRARLLAQITEADWQAVWEDFRMVGRDFPVIGTKDQAGE